MKKAKLFIGTSGWVYSHWDGVFYPKGLAHKDKLKYFSGRFKTVEINYSFYHLPRSTTYKNWYNQTPKDFIFAVKASRFITHIKRLKSVKTAWRTFIDNALYLKEKLGPILFQFPPSFKATEENLKRLESFLKLITKNLKPKTYKLKHAFEFRDDSWLNKDIYKLLRKYKAGFVVADSPRYPKKEALTADFVYIRMHGSQRLFSSKYTDKELKDWAKVIRKFLNQKRDVYCYFNNDFMGFAVENARTLVKLLKGLDTI